MSETIKTWTKLEGVQIPDIQRFGLVNCNGIGHMFGTSPATIEKHNHFVFDFETKEVAKKAAIPLSNSHDISGICIGNKIYVGGGASNYISINKFFCYNTDEDIWTALADIPVAADYYSFGAVDNSVYVCGGILADGQGTHHAFGSLFRYDIQTNTWERKSDMLLNAVGAANMSYYRGALYFFGGGAPTNGQYNNFDSCQKYVIAEDRWYVFSSPPKNSFFPAMTTWNDKIYLMGGFYIEPDGSTSYANNVYEYSLQKNHWTELANLPISMAFGTAMAYKNKIYLIGGTMRSGSSKSRDIYSYELEPSTKLKIVLEKGKTVQLKGLMLPQGVTVEDATWSTEDAGIATVDATGLVTAVDVGVVRITVEAKDKSWNDSVLVKVEEAPEYRLSILLKESGSCQLTIDNTSDKKETWVSSELTVATVSQDGKITAASEGIALITVSIEGEDYTENIYVKVEKAS